jgi:hypothetical protein
VRGAWVGLLIVVVGCGKHPVDSTREQEQPPPWDPPTIANGFHPVIEQCKVVHTDKLAATQRGTLEVIADGTQPRNLVSDGTNIYWVDGQQIHRAVRGTEWSRPWIDGVIAGPGEESIVDLAATHRYVYWSTFKAPNQRALYAWEPATAQTTRIYTGSASKLVAQGDRVTWMTEGERGAIREIVTLDDSGGRQQTPLVLTEPDRVFAVDKEGPIVLNRESFFVRTPPLWSMPKTLGAAVDPVDAFSDGTFFYWIERGPEGASKPEDCIPNGYQSSRSTHPSGKLRRVSLEGGPIADLFDGIPNAEAITVVRGILWISTRDGLLRYDPSCHLPPVRVAAGKSVYGRAAAVGDALAVMTVDFSDNPSRAHVALLGSP